MSLNQVTEEVLGDFDKLLDWWWDLSPHNVTKENRVIAQMKFAGLLNHVCTQMAEETKLSIDTDIPKDSDLWVGFTKAKEIQQQKIKDFLNN